LLISGAQTRKCLNRISWDPFCRLLELTPENAPVQVCPLSLLAPAFLSILPIAPTLLPILLTIAVGYNLSFNSAHCRYQLKLPLQFRPLSLLALTLFAILPTVAFGPGSNFQEVPGNSFYVFLGPGCQMVSDIIIKLLSKFLGPGC
jgi:hypothetical protein